MELKFHCRTGAWTLGEEALQMNLRILKREREKEPPMHTDHWKHKEYKQLARSMVLVHANF